MKRILFALPLLLVGCVNQETKVVDSPDRSVIKLKGYAFDMDVVPIEFRSHDYFMFMAPSMSDKGFSTVHNPDCKKCASKR